MENPLKYFAELRDPRVERNREHLLEEVLLIAIAAVLSGAESWNDIADYGEAKLLWLKTFLTLPSGIPSHDTFNRVFAALDPEQLEKGFVAWVGSIAKLTAGEVVAIDGKALCGTRESGKKAIVHMVSAWAEGNGLVLAQRKVEEKSNEITAIPKLLEALVLSGTVVTIDAMGCQKSIAGKIVAKKADYILAVKENQGNLLDGIRDSFQMLAADAVAEEIDCGHGRVERRTCSAIADLSLVEKAMEWPSLQGLVRVEAERFHKTTGKTERETRFYITSAYLAVSAERNGLWFRFFRAIWEGQKHPISACKAQVHVRRRDRAGFEKRPSDACAGYGERRIHRDKPEVVRGSRRGRCRSTTVAGSRWADRPVALPISSLCEGRFARAGCVEHAGSPPVQNR